MNDRIRSTRPGPGLRMRTARRPLVLALAAVLAPPLAMAQALPTNPTGLVGIAPGDIATVGNTMTIQQGGRGGVINWETFSIGADSRVDFNHAVAGGVTLNRVIGTSGQLSRSEIAGLLNAPNGSVFLLNPAGVTFAAGSQVNVGGLVASTLGMSDDTFLAGAAGGQYALDVVDGFAIVLGADVINAGAIEVSGGGTVALVGSGGLNPTGGGRDAVRNSGTINAPGGSVLLSSGQRVLLDPYGDGLTQLTIALGSAYGVDNSGTIAADGGRIQLASSGVADNPFRGTIHAGDLRADLGEIVVDGAAALDSASGATVFTDGAQQADGGSIVLRTGGDSSVNIRGAAGEAALVRARTVGERAGTITIRGGTVVLGSFEEGNYPGVIDATGTETGERGGDIQIEAGTIQIAGNVGTGGTCDAGEALCSRIDSSGDSGGGNIVLDAQDTLAIDGDGDGTEASVQIRSDALASGQAGRIDIGGEAQRGGVVLTGDVLLSATGFGTATGGRIDIDSGSETRLEGGQGELHHPSLIASGAAGGGAIRLSAGTSLAAGAGSILRADATATGAGGEVWTRSDDVLDLRGLQVTAGGPDGAGRWQIESGRGLAILPANLPLLADPGTSLVDDAALSAALSAGSDVSIAVRSGQEDADITITRGVAIDHAGSQQVGLTLQAQGGRVLGEGTFAERWTIGSSGGPLDITLDATSTLDLLYGTLSSAGGDIGLYSRASESAGIALDSVRVDSQGGDVVLDGGQSAEGGVFINQSQLWTGGGSLSITGRADTGPGVVIGNGSDLDSRAGRTDAGAGGAVTISGTGAGTESGAGIAIYGSTVNTASGALTLDGRVAGVDGAYGAGVQLVGASLASTSGAISIFGSATGDGTGVVLEGLAITDFGGSPLPGLIRSGSGDISIRGVGGATAGGSGGDGISARNYDISSVSGAIAMSGRGVQGGAMDDVEDRAGLHLGGGARVASATGDIALDGFATGPGAGLAIEGADGLGAAAQVQAGRNLLLRAGNGGSEALRIAGAVSAQGMANLRAGTVDGDGIAADDRAAAMRLGGSDAFVSMASLANIDTPALVVGHAGHAGAITVAEALARDGDLSLQNTGGAGGISLQGAIDLGTGTLALASGGTITQATDAAITAGALLARSTAGDVALATAANTVGTLAGDAAGRFDFRNTGALTIGSVEATAAAGTLSASGTTAGTALLVQTLAGDLTLAAGVAGTDVDLVAAGRFQNTAGASVTAGNRWRVWADTWIGETRGGLAGSGPLPNLFNCSFGGPCGVDADTVGNHFIYRQQPVLTVDIGDATREYGLDNPVFGFTVEGLVFADDVAANVVSGFPTTWATIGSDVGSYPIDGSFGSAAGYAVQVNPGTLAITPATLTYLADAYRRLYGDPNGVLGGIVTGFRNGDTLADLDGLLQFLTDAIAGSDVGRHAINGSGLSSGNYVFVQAPGNATALTIDPATLLYVANPLDLFYGQPFAGFSGTVTGFRNGDTLGNLDGSLVFSTTGAAGTFPGVYPILGSGLSASNYVFEQAPSNFTALRVVTTPPMDLPDMVRLPPETYVYSSNVGQMAMCAATGPLDGTRLDAAGDPLGREWSRVRSRPNLTSCVATDRKNSCSDF